MAIMWLIAGLVMLGVGAEVLIRGGVGLARRFNVSPLLIGVTIVAYGTSTPELVVSVDAALKGIDGIAVGNVVGSNIFNVLVILGLTAVVMPIAISRSAVLRDTMIMLAASAALVAIAFSGDTVEAWHGVAFLVALLLYTLLTYLAERRGGTASGDLHAAEGEKVSAATASVFGNLVFVVAGIALLVLGGELLVNAAVDIARTLGVSDAVIGLTIVAAGTSLPEVAASVVAALRGQPAIAVGNVLGSSIYNILAILGVASVITPLSIDPEIGGIDIWVMLGASGLALLPMMVANGIGRLAGLGLLLLYGAYLWSLLARNGLV